MEIEIKIKIEACFDQEQPCGVYFERWYQN